MGLPDFLNPSVAAKAWAEQFDLRVEAETQLKLEHEKVQLLLPKASVYDEVMSSPDTLSMNETAKLLNLPHLGQNNLFALLRKNKILMSNNLPYQTPIDQGYFKIIEKSWTDKDGLKHISCQTRVTQKGLDWLVRTLKPVSSLLPKPNVSHR